VTPQNLVGKNLNKKDPLLSSQLSADPEISGGAFIYIFFYRGDAGVLRSARSQIKNSQKLKWESVYVVISKPHLPYSTLVRLDNFANVVNVLSCRAPSNYRGNSSICIRKWRDFPLEFYSYCPVPDFPMLGKYKPDGDISTSSIYWNREEIGGRRYWKSWQSMCALKRQ
jgi:hypothetical protein